MPTKEVYRSHLNLAMGIYIHIPFCKQKCSYCDFHFSTSFEAYRWQMVEALCTEIELRKNYINPCIPSIYFGGGTPSLLNKEELSLIFSTLSSHFLWDESAEITLEANPDDITDEKLAIWKSVGINRLSIGLQSFKEEDLLMMNRAHNANEALTAVEKAKSAGIDKISIDLMYGLPNLSLDEWKNHILQAIALDVDHISAYCLTLEKGTLLQQQVTKGSIIAAGEDAQSDQFVLLLETLASNEYEQYEISNFARNNAYAVHNTSYWLGKPYLGIGPSAHSFNGTERRWNIANNASYMKSMGLNDSWFEAEILSDKDRWNELILTGLRTKFGVQLDELSAIKKPSPEFLQRLAEFEQANLIININETITLTTAGKLQADYIASELFL
ncbi:MAG: radical SAM family heme chaperone HemW [Bacteroidota bacterium]